jgi:hypothetical protein
MKQLHHTLVGADRFVELVAGLHVWAEKLDALLARDTTCEERAPDHAVDLVLGLVAIRARLAATLAASVHAVPSVHAPDPARESLLR